jgi:hypothetical protein
MDVFSYVYPVSAVISQIHLYNDIYLYYVLYVCFIAAQWLTRFHLFRLYYFLIDTSCLVLLFVFVYEFVFV